MSSEVVFLLALDRHYRHMATALVHTIERFHRDPEIRVYTMAGDLEILRAWAARFSSVVVLPYDEVGRFDFGDWHPLIWAKLEAFALTDAEVCVVLDVDQIMYKPVTEHVAAARRSGKVIAASPDMTRLHGHMRESRLRDPDLAGLADAPCFNAGAMIIRPDRGVHQDLLALAERYHRHMILPEQGVLNLWAHLCGGHHDLGERFMMQPMSPRVLEPEIPSCLVHFWTPRPAFFGLSPARAGEPTWAEFSRDFARETGRDYPVSRFRADFELRLDNFAKPGPTARP